MTLTVNRQQTSRVCSACLGSSFDYVTRVHPSGTFHYCADCVASGVIA